MRWQSFVGYQCNRVTMRWIRPLGMVLLAAAVLAEPAAADEYHLSPHGDDQQTGTAEAPWLTFAHAIDQAEPGDTIWVHGGTYPLGERVLIDKAGEAGNPIRLFAAPGETPVLDFSRNPVVSAPAGDFSKIDNRANGIELTANGNHWHLKGLVVQRAPQNGLLVMGSNNVVEQLVLRENEATGLTLGGSASDNLILNCDSYLNFDPRRNGEDADGFGAKFEELGPGNVFRGTRSWANSDDGYDLWHAGQPVVLEDAWAYANGFHRAGWEERFHLKDQPYRGDGMGFKLGQDSAAHILRRVVAWDNKGYGITSNGNSSEAGLTVLNATTYANNGGVNIALGSDGPHVIRNSISCEGEARLAPSVVATHNTWNGIGASSDDFISLSDDVARGPRQADGSLPVSGFLRLKPGSPLVDSGADVGLPFHGEAPDLGAFETADAPSAP